MPPKSRLHFDENGWPVHVKYQETKRMHQMQAQINEVADIMRQNLESLLSRDESVTELSRRADFLQTHASYLLHTAKTTKHTLEKKQAAKRSWIIAIVLLVLTVVVAFSLFAWALLTRPVVSVVSADPPAKAASEPPSLVHPSPAPDLRLNDTEHSISIPPPSAVSPQKNPRTRWTGERSTNNGYPGKRFPWRR